MCLGHATYITGLDCCQTLHTVTLRFHILVKGWGGEHKKLIQLIQPPAQKSHYTADEFKDCQRWKETVLMAQQLSLSSLLVSCGWKTDYPVKLILNTILFKYCIVDSAYLNMFVRRCDALCDVFMAATKWRWMCLFDESIWPWYVSPHVCYIIAMEELSILIQAVTCSLQQSYRSKTAS